jgi:hypothetical protein
MTNNKVEILFGLNALSSLNVRSIQVGTVFAVGMVFAVGTLQAA